MDHDANKQPYTGPSGQSGGGAINVRQFALFDRSPWDRVARALAKRLHQIEASPQLVAATVAEWIRMYGRYLPQSAEPATVRGTVQGRLEELQSGDADAFARSLNEADHAVANIKASDPALAMDIGDSPKTLRLVLVCRALANIANADGEFSLSVRQAAEVVGAFNVNGEPDEKAGWRCLKSITGKDLSASRGNGKYVGVVKAGNARTREASTYKLLERKPASIDMDDVPF